MRLLVQLGKAWLQLQPVTNWLLTAADGGVAAGATGSVLGVATGGTRVVVASGERKAVVAGGRVTPAEASREKTGC